MGFRDREKLRQRQLDSQIFENDQFGGISANKPRDFCLQEPRRNLYESFRVAAIEYFENRKITWHKKRGEPTSPSIPSNHICCSQSCCVNFNFPFMDDPEGLKKQLTLLEYSVKEVLPIELDKCDRENSGNYVGFEWIGQENYLQEHGKKRSRGKYATSADFIIRFRQDDDKIHIILGEWKYTEYYEMNKYIRYSKKTDRLNDIYRLSLESPNCQIKIDPNEYDGLFYDPFDQLMRLQLLASKMEEAHEMQADIVSTIHIVPEANKEFRSRRTSAKLAKYGDTVHAIWTNLVEKERFKGYYLERILSKYCDSYQKDDIRKYIQTRYGNMK